MKLQILLERVQIGLEAAGHRRQFARAFAQSFLPSDRTHILHPCLYIAACRIPPLIPSLTYTVVRQTRPKLDRFYPGICGLLSPMGGAQSRIYNPWRDKKTEDLRLASLIPIIDEEPEEPRSIPKLRFFPTNPDDSHQIPLEPTLNYELSTNTSQSTTALTEPSQGVTKSSSRLLDTELFGLGHVTLANAERKGDQQYEKDGGYDFNCPTPAKQACSSQKEAEESLGKVWCTYVELGWHMLPPSRLAMRVLKCIDPTERKSGSAPK